MALDGNAPWSTVGSWFTARNLRSARRWICARRVPLSGTLGAWIRPDRARSTRRPAAFNVRQRHQCRETRAIGNSIRNVGEVTFVAVGRSAGAS